MIEFHANEVDTLRNVFSEDFVVYNIFFEESDPEKGGESWNFQRALGADGTIESLGEEDEGVCTVKEIQQVTLYEGIKSVELSRNKLICLFEPDAQNETKIEGLIITYEISDEQWNKLQEMANYVFKNRNYFKAA